MEKVLRADLLRKEILGGQTILHWTVPENPDAAPGPD
jgi:hypothetical protein